MDAGFGVVDERVADSILRTAFRASYPRYREGLARYLIEEMNDYRRGRIAADELPELLRQVTEVAVRHLKGRRQSPQAVRSRLTKESSLLIKLAADVYERYERGLAVRGALDFDDLIAAAIRALDADETLVEDLRRRWPFILEDEAQDSSTLQEQILRKLVGGKGNWVRVGDPNQAIYQTFTTAHPEYLRAFLAEADVRRDLPNSGRSGLPVIRLANELIRWVREDHPVEAMRDALDPPFIEPAPPGDPQPNPPPGQCRVAFQFLREPDAELDRVVASAKKWLSANGTATVAMLVPTNARGAGAIRALRAARVPCTDALLRLTTTTREAAGALSLVLRHLAHPELQGTLTQVYKVWYTRVLKEAGSEEGQKRLETHLELLGRCARTEEFVWPLAAGDEPWNAGLDSRGIPADTISCFERFRDQLQQWQALVLLPVGELLTAIAQDLFEEPEKLAMTHLFAETLQARLQYNLGAEGRSTTLDEMEKELGVIARDQRRNLRSIETDKTGFDPEEHKGEVVVATMHAAKGLEWDRVYLLGVDDYEFPAGEPTDRFREERWFVRDNLSLEAETLARLDAAIDGTEYEEGSATLSARHDYARERLRLLYVGITRARKELLITGNAGPKGSNGPAVACLALQEFPGEGQWHDGGILVTADMRIRNLQCEPCWFFGEWSDAQDNCKDMLSFSAYSLQAYVDCARRFELSYLERLKWPAVESEPPLERRAPPVGRTPFPRDDPPRRTGDSGAGTGQRARPGHRPLVGQLPGAAACGRRGGTVRGEEAGRSDRRAYPRGDVRPDRHRDGRRSGDAAARPHLRLEDLAPAASEGVAGGAAADTGLPLPAGAGRRGGRRRPAAESGGDRDGLLVRGLPGRSRGVHLQRLPVRRRRCLPRRPRGRDRGPRPGRGVRTHRRREEVRVLRLPVFLRPRRRGRAAGRRGFRT